MHYHSLRPGDPRGSQVAHTLTICESCCITMLSPSSDFLLATFASGGHRRTPLSARLHHICARPAGIAAEAAERRPRRKETFWLGQAAPLMWQ